MLLCSHVPLSHWQDAERLSLANIANNMCLQCMFGSTTANWFTPVMERPKHETQVRKQPASSCWDKRAQYYYRSCVLQLLFYSTGDLPSPLLKCCAECRQTQLRPILGREVCPPRPLAFCRHFACCNQVVELPINILGASHILQIFPGLSAYTCNISSIPLLCKLDDV